MKHNLQFVYPEVAEKYSEMLQQDFQWTSWKKEVETIEDGIVVPAESFTDDAGYYRYRGGVLTRDARFVESSGLYTDLKRTCAPLSMAECPDVKLDECRYVDEEVVYYGLFIYHWGHFLFESTSRLWYYVLNDCKSKGLKLAAIRSGNKPDGNFRLFHELLGITENDLLFIDEPTQFRRIHIPNASCMLSWGVRRFCSPEFLIPFDAIRNSIPDNESIEKIYLTRTALPDCNVIGEAEIERNFAQNGFQVIAPEQLRLTELVAKLKHAKQVAGLCGSNAHNLLFA